MAELQWFFPKTVDELRDLLSDEGNLVHGGGTGLLKRGLGRKGIAGATGLIDLSAFVCPYGFPADFVSQEIDCYRFGALNSYATTAESMSAIDKGHILAKALVASVPPALRNRITLGGSIAFFPMWSDLVGPLLALDAKLRIVGKTEGVHPVLDYITQPELHKNTCIVYVEFPRLTGYRSHYYRAKRVTFDYSQFNITILGKIDGKIEDLRAVVVGTKRKFTRLDRLEQALIGKSIAEIEVDWLDEYFDLEFSDKAIGSADYVKHLATVELRRGLQALLGGAR